MPFTPVEKPKEPCCSPAILVKETFYQNHVRCDVCGQEWKKELQNQHGEYWNSWEKV